LIFAETDELLDYMGDLPPITPVSAPANVTRRVDQYRVPAPEAVTVRPLQDFYAGAAPAWCDVYRHDVHRIRQYREAANAVDVGRHVILTGIPASGKTTVLMQLAASDVGRGLTLMPDGLTASGADRLGRLLQGGHATVCVDDVCDDIDVFNVLASFPNIVIAAADRDYNLSTVMHRLQTHGAQFISTSEISKYDLGAIRAHIPGSIRTREMRRPEITGGQMPSLLEFNITNTTSSSLTLRLEDALQKLQEEKPRLSEMLLAVSYVHSCRTPMSLDMAIAYWRDEVSDWSEIYNLVEQVGQLLAEYEGDLTEDDQDYFAARSMIVAEAAIAAAGTAALKRLLLRFHHNIATTRICRYDVFRRRAYSADTFSRAFSDIEEAASFYDFLFERDENPYLLQQKALILSRRGRHKESFVEIDRALGMTRGKNWTIQATHANLLMRANFDLAATDLGARAQVDRGMEILRKCYLSDRRRSLHALKFAGRAIEYYDLFGDDQARDHLIQAREWLQGAQSREPWLTRTGWLLREIGRRVS